MAKPSPGLPMYSPIAIDYLDDTCTSASSGGQSSSNSDPSLSENETGQLSPVDPLHPAQHHASTPPSSIWPSRPSLSRFLADFTLGFADGLTVPFALTAGLSSLGQTDTVIYAGMAEICAGSISMGIGGYLSSKGEAREACKATNTIKAADVDVDEDEKTGVAAVVKNYLAPLDLPSELLDLVHQHIVLRSGITSTLLQRVATEEEADENAENVLPSSVVVGLSVAVGYLIGGILPLFPYFVVDHVRDGLTWSFVVCVIALFAFGFGKDFILHREQDKERVLVKKSGFSKGWKEDRAISWKNIRRSTWEGSLLCRSSLDYTYFLFPPGRATPANSIALWNTPHFMMMMV